MIQAILFDYGGVMSTGGKGKELVVRLMENLGISEKRGFEILDSGWDEYASGRISEDDLWARMETIHGAPIPLEKRDIWNPWDVMRPQPEMVAYVEKLKSDGLQVGLLSNVIPFTMQQIREHGAYDVFDFTVLSAEVKYGKPEIEIYQLALDQLPGIAPGEVVFIDDQERFLVPARKLGIQTVLAVNPPQIIKDTNGLIEGQSHQT